VATKKTTNKQSAKKSNVANSTSTKETKITRIKAVEEKVEPKKTAKVVKKAEAKAVVSDSEAAKKLLSPLVSIGGYFKGAWYELRQVRWPNRKATWSLTVAVLIFTAFFIALIVLLDAGFKLLFQKILGY